MFHITEEELTAALAKLPPPDSISGPCYTIPVAYLSESVEGRCLTFRKVTADNGVTEWFLHHTPWPLAKGEFTVWHQPEVNQDKESGPVWPFADAFDAIMRDGRPGGRTSDDSIDIDDAAEQTEWEAMVSAAVDMMVETVTNGDSLTDEDGQAALNEAMQLLIPLFDLENCEHLGDRCRDREKDLLREAAEAGNPYFTVGEDYTPSLEELQDAAYARGEPGPLDDKPVAIETVEVTVEAADIALDPRFPDSYEEVLTTVLQANGEKRNVDRADAVLLIERLFEKLDWDDCRRILDLVQHQFDMLNFEADLAEKRAAEVRAAALKAHKEGRLLAQCATDKPEKIPYGYEIEFDGETMVCAIGAVLNRDSLDQIAAEEYQFTTLRGDREDLSHIFACSQEDYPALVHIQSAHDNWLRFTTEGLYASAVAEERLFLELLHG